MTESELQIFRDSAWDSGWNAAITCVVHMLRSRITLEDATREDYADEFEKMRVGSASATK